MAEDLERAIELMKKAISGDNSPEDNTLLTDPDIQLMLSDMIQGIRDGDPNREKLREVLSVLRNYREKAEEKIQQEIKEGNSYGYFTLGCLYEVEADLASYLGEESEEIYRQALQFYDEIYSEADIAVIIGDFTDYPLLHNFDEILRDNSTEANSGDYRSRIEEKIENYTD